MYTPQYDHFVSVQFKKQPIVPYTQAVQFPEGVLDNFLDLSTVKDKAAFQPGFCFLNGLLRAWRLRKGSKLTESLCFFMKETYESPSTSNRLVSTLNSGSKVG